MRAAALLPLAVLLLASPRSDAEERLQAPTLAQRGALIVSFERLFGYSVEDFGPTFEPERAARHFGVGSLLGPRIGVYGIARGGFTAGGFLASFAVMEEGRRRTAVSVFGPRLGWLFSTEVVGVWPRVGLTWVVGPASALSYALEVPLTLHVTRHAGLLVGPSIELPVERDMKSYTSVAFSAGIFGAL